MPLIAHLHDRSENIQEWLQQRKEIWRQNRKRTTSDHVSSISTSKWSLYGIISSSSCPLYSSIASLAGHSTQTNLHSWRVSCVDYYRPTTTLSISSRPVLILSVFILLFPVIFMSLLRRSCPLRMQPKSIRSFRQKNPSSLYINCESMRNDIRRSLTPSGRIISTVKLKISLVPKYSILLECHRT